MATADPHLDDLLPRLEAAWRRHGAPIAESLAPGRSGTELDDLAAERKLTLPAELRRWWAWHDGVARRQPGTRLGIESRLGAGPWEFLSIVEALQERESKLSVVGGGDIAWRPSWLPVLAYDANVVFVDTDRDRDGRVPVQVWFREPEELDRLRAPSWSAAVALFVDLLDSGVFAWSSVHGAWTHRRADIPEAALATGLA